MVVKNKKEIAERLRRVRKIKYSKHFEKDRLPYRTNITKDIIETNLKEKSIPCFLKSL